MENKYTSEYIFFKNNKIWNTCPLVMIAFASLYKINPTPVK